MVELRRRSNGFGEPLNGFSMVGLRVIGVPGEPLIAGEVGVARDLASAWRCSCRSWARCSTWKQCSAKAACAEPRRAEAFAGVGGPEVRPSTPQRPMGETPPLARWAAMVLKVGVSAPDVKTQCTGEGFDERQKFAGDVEPMIGESDGVITPLP